MIGPGGAGEGDRYRPDLEGLRAVAVLLIVLYHAGVPGFSGGYVGVDVFFVLSGFFITGILVRDVTGTGTISLGGFYARRARRILPAAFLVLLATAVAALLIESPLRFRETAKEVAASAVYVPNLWFASLTTDYLHPFKVSPVLHFWSLGVEEQFYLLWPAFILVATRLGARTPGRLAIQVGAVVLGSFALSALETPGRPTDAFYLLPTRAWELGVGALTAIGASKLASATKAMAPVLGWIGLGLIGLAAVAFDDATLFPGYAAALPVLGAAFLIVAGLNAAPHLASKLMSLGPLRYVGKISYSLYLWHWPLLVLGPAAVGSLLPPTVVAGGAVTLSVALAAASYRWVEAPLRQGVWIGSRPRRNLGLGLAASILLAIVALGLGRIAIVRFDTPVAAMRPSTGEPSSENALTPLVSGGLPQDLIPRLLDVDATVPRPTYDGCNVTGNGTTSGACTYGDEASATTVVLFGDSHALQWFPAVERIAIERHWRLINLTKDACPFAEIARLTQGRRHDIACDQWRASALARIASVHPILVVASANHAIRPAVGDRDATDAEAQSIWATGVDVSVHSLVDAAPGVLVLGDSPESPRDVPECLASNPDHVEACGFPRSAATDAVWQATERSIVSAAGGSYIDPSPWICPTDPCTMIRGQYLVFTDTNHLAAPFVAALAPALTAVLPGG